MSNTMGFCELSLVPKYGFCDVVKIRDDPERKIVWLVPRVIKHADDAELITWRCNWGNACKSACIYGMAKESAEEIPLTEDILRKKNLTLTRE